MESKKKFSPDPRLKLMDQVKQVLHYHHYAYRTEKTYCDWILRFLRFHKMKKASRIHGKKRGGKDIATIVSPLDALPEDAG